MTESWDVYAAGWDSNEAVMSYSRKAFASLREVTDVEGLEVFDFGCGTGLLTEQIAKYAGRTVALDPSSKMVAVLKSKNLQNADIIAEEVTEELLQSRPEVVAGFDLLVDDFMELARTLGA